jgi:hypothetical protein
LASLVKTANLEREFGIAQGANKQLEVFWGVVKDWTEESRYQDKGKAEAEQLYEAIVNEPDGVLKWIKSHW